MKREKDTERKVAVKALLAHFPEITKLELRFWNAGFNGGWNAYRKYARKSALKSALQQLVAEEKMKNAAGWKCRNCGLIIMKDIKPWKKDECPHYYQHDFVKIKKTRATKK